METQNVSAQLYKKQLPEQFDGNFGCMDTGSYLSTCVKDISSDVSIEDAFQKQLDLSLYYKNKKVYDAMKNDFMSQTMEGKNNKEETKPVVQQMPVMSVPTPAGPVVGPRDFLQNMIINKSSFGSSGATMMYIFIFILIVMGGLCFYMHKNPNAPWVVKLKNMFNLKK
jgi:hypothetical protein